MSSIQCSSACKLARNQCNTDIQLHEVKYLWTIDNFNFHEAIGNDLVSSTFSAPNYHRVKWFLLVKPNGETDAKNTVSLYVCLSPASTYDSANEKIFAKCSASVLDSQQNEICCTSSIAQAKVREYAFTSSNNIVKSRYGRPKFLNKDTNFTNSILTNNRLVISFTMIFSVVPNIVSNTVHQCPIVPLYSDVPVCNLVGNLEMLLEDHKFTDIVLSVRNKEYRAHKAILAVRSSVFAAMFEHNFKENESNRIEIGDTNEEVVAEMLRYIYTGKCEISEDLVDGLLAAADKYNMDQLKIMCVEALYRTLSVDNAVNILALADLHSVAELKTETIKFIVARFAEVVVSTAWKNILVSHAELVEEVCQAVAGHSKTANKRNNTDTSVKCKRSRIE